MRRSNPAIQPACPHPRRSFASASAHSRCHSAPSPKSADAPCSPFSKRFTVITFILFVFLHQHFAPAPNASPSFSASAAPLTNDAITTTDTNTEPHSNTDSSSHSMDATNRVPVTEPLSNRSDHQSSESDGSSPSDPPPPANIAYFIQIAENTLHHLPRLLSTIYHPQNLYAVHFDLKIPRDQVAAMRDNLFSAHPHYKDNVHIMESELITYRGVSMLLNTINAMRLLLDVAHPWHYFINISGADYPLINPDTQRELLGQHTGLNFFTFAPKRTWDEMAEHRLSEVWYDESLTFRPNPSLGKLTRLVVRNPLVDDRQFDVSHAEAWMIASRDFCDFVVRGDMARKMLVAFAYAVDSSEHYFASLAWNHEGYKESLVPHSLREIIWVHEGKLAGQHPYYVDEQDEDGGYKFAERLQASVLFFARKFKHADSKLMDLMDKRASDPDVIEKVATHFTNKIKCRALRVSEL